MLTFKMFHTRDAKSGLAKTFTILPFQLLYTKAKSNYFPIKRQKCNTNTMTLAKAINPASW